MKKLGFALGAGGSRGVAHVGFLKAMQEEGITPDYVAGCSMGSVVGAAYCAGMTIEEMKKAVEKLRILDLIMPSAKRGGIFDTKRIRKLLEGYIGDIEFSDLKIPYRCIAVDLITQEVVDFHEGKVLDGIVASSCIPGIFKPVVLGEKRLVDGGVLQRVPYKTVKNMGADVVVCVDVLGWRECKKEVSTTIGTLLEVFDVMDNARTKAGKERDEGLFDVWIEPDLEDMSPYSCKRTAFAIEQGYLAGKAYAKKIKDLLK